MMKTPFQSADSPGRASCTALSQLCVLGIMAVTVFGLTSCGERTVDMDMQMFRASSAQQEELIRGREAYMLYCVGCHGEAGDGQGPAADFLNPKPRDFTKGTFKYTAVASGELARDEDLLRTLNRGLPGSSMPEWNLLDEATKAALIAYIKQFSPRFAEDSPGQALPVMPDPYHGNPAAVDMAIARGRTVYHGLAGCYNCHPAYVSHDDIRTAATEMESFAPPEFPEDLYREKMKKSDTWGFDIRPPDFTRRRLSNGTEPADLYRVINAGVGGTAMPTWSGVLEPNDIWAMAYYVRALSQMRGTADGKELRARFGIR